MPVVNRRTIANSDMVQGRRNVYTFSKTFNSTAANSIYTQWTASGIPVAGVNTGGVAYTGAQCTSSTTGAIFFGSAPTSHKRFLRLVRSVNSVGANGTLLVLDRLVQFPGINHATLGTTALTDPGLPRYTTGAGVMAFLEVTTGLNAVAHTVQLTYTDQGGTGGNVTTAMTPIASSAADRVPFASAYFSLASGDTGIRSLTNVIVASAGAPTGTSCLVLAKPICEIPLSGITNSVMRGEVELLDRELDLPQIEDGACLMFLLVTQSVLSAPQVRGIVKSSVVKTS